nr:thioredoxin domain-containing protein [Amycolatopsis thailandensis]
MNRAAGSEAHRPARVRSRVRCQAAAPVHLPRGRNRDRALLRGEPTEGLAITVDAGETDFAQVAERATMPVGDLWAAWCGPCRQVSPALAQLARERSGRAVHDVDLA